MLADGTIYQGSLFGAPGQAAGEVVFATGMTGYQEAITDPSYWGQILVFTYPLIGNTGINPEDFESWRPHVRGLVVRELCQLPSHWQATQTLSEYLARFGVVGLTDVDTRALTRVLREYGTTNGVITAAPGPGTGVEGPPAAGADLRAPGGLVALRGQWRVPVPEEVVAWLAALMEQARRFRLTGAVEAVTVREPFRVEPEPAGAAGGGAPAGGAAAGAERAAAPRVVLLDMGAKQNILRSLVRLGCQVTVVPAHAGADEILALGPDGVVISNGPGDPKEATSAIETARRLLAARVPIMGICLGHQILALAFGGDTYKMKFGHRGVNHPVKDLATGRVFITTQNHGYAVDEASLPPGVVVTHRNLSDGTVEGLAAVDLPAFSVQYHPEACPGPEESRYLFERFLQMVRQYRARRDPSEGGPGHAATA